MSNLTTTSKLIANVRGWLLNIDELGIERIYRGNPATTPPLPAIRLFTGARQVIMDYDYYAFATTVNMDIQSTSMDELDDLELTIVNEVLANKNEITNILSDDTVHVYEFKLQNFAEDMHVVSREDDKSQFTVRQMIFSCSYYQAGADLCERGILDQYEV